MSPLRNIPFSHKIITQIWLKKADNQNNESGVSRYSSLFLSLKQNPISNGNDSKIVPESNDQIPFRIRGNTDTKRDFLKQRKQQWLRELMQRHLIVSP
jgi:hypothetical protein